MLLGSEDIDFPLIIREIANMKIYWTVRQKTSSLEVPSDDRPLYEEITQMVSR